MGIKSGSQDGALLIPPASSLPTHTKLKEHPQGRMQLKTLSLCIALALFSTVSLAFAPFRVDPRGLVLGEAVARAPPNTNYTDQVQFDNYSLVVKGQRIFLHSGEFHTYRLPVPSLWPDILEKVKAAGMNAISVYTHMGAINPSRGVVDFDGYRALQPLYDAAMKAGVWVVLRPGPYINSETSAGGVSHWITSEIAGRIRTNDTDWRDAWEAYISGIIDITVENQITRGGPVIAVQIDNEYSQRQPGRAEYFEQLIAKYRGSEMELPLTYNDPNQGSNFINGTGAVDLYGLDSYPLGFDCSNPTVWKPVTTSYDTYHMRVNPSQPFYVPEFQGGAFDPWGPTAPGYSACGELTGPNFQSVFNKQLWASNAKLINYYMLYGGTSWGAIPFPGVYTSYDYGAAISESRLLTPKYTELKRQGLFLRSTPDFWKTDVVGNSTTGAVKASNSAAFGTLLQNPDTQARFYVMRQNDSTSTADISFTLDIETKDVGTLRIPQVARSIQISGRQSKVIVTDYTFGSSKSKLLYSTAEVLFAGTIDGRDVLYLFGLPTEEHEFVFPTRSANEALAPPSNVRVQAQAGQSIVSIERAVVGLVTIFDSKDQLVLYSDTDTAGTFWAPVIARPSSKESDPFSAFWQFGTNETILVGGPYVVREATISGSHLALRGDLETSTRLDVIAPSAVTSITWNGQEVGLNVQASSALSVRSAFVGQVQVASDFGIVVPKLEKWRFADSLPEIRGDFSDKKWVMADKRTTNIPQGIVYGDGRVLYGCDYGFCENMVLWRGHFNATGRETSVNLTINGGDAFAGSVWLNNVFLGTAFGNSTKNLNRISEVDKVYAFPNGTLRRGKDNVITVIHDNMGLNQGDENSSKNPRGIRGFALNSGNFSEWRVQGKIGGYKNYPDKYRGLMNEGGLYGERKGWHLPGFDTSSWTRRDLAQGLPNGLAGVGFFVTTFKLDIADGLDAALSFTFEQEVGQAYRALLFVNGWHMGKRVANLGPQFKFPVHQGILNFKGSNTVAVALWSLLNTPVSPQLSLTLDSVIEGDLGRIEVNNPKWSSKGRE